MLILKSDRLYLTLMPYKKQLAILLFLCTNCLPFTYGQHKCEFEIHLAGKSIGGITAKLQSIDNKQVYDILSEVNFKVLWKKYNRQTKNFIVYGNDIIVESYSGIYMNHVLEDSASIQAKGESYKFYRFPDKNFTTEKRPIKYLAAMLYFQEPKNITEVYSERFLSYCKLESKGNGKYIIYLPNGKENVYTYENGKLMEVFVDRTWFNLRFKRI